MRATGRPTFIKIHTLSHNKKHNHTPGNQ